MNTLKRFFITLLVASILWSCGGNEVTGPPRPTLELQALRVEAVEVALKLTLNDTLRSTTFQLKRDGTAILSGQLIGTETTVIDSTVLPAQTYLYRAFLLQDGQPTDSSNILTVTTLDTTSHNYTWEIQTIGVFQSFLSDVWGTSPTNVYAVGQVEVPAGETQSNIIHFDGNSWRTVTEAAFDTGFVYGEFWGIYGFSEEDIWVVGTNVLHWDGNEWNPFAFTLIRTGPTSAGIITLDTLLAENQFTAIWGTSSNNLFAVGAGGVIVHYDGQQWTKMESGTEINLWDVWGFSSTNVYCVGADFFGGTGILLHYDGEKWQEVKLESNETNRLFGIWGAASINVMTIGDFTYRFDGQRWRRVNVPDLNILKQKVMGTAVNDIFVAGDFGLLLHWNGASWKRYDEVSFNGRILGLWTDGRELVAVGRTNALGVIIHGKLQ